MRDACRRSRAVARGSRAHFRGAPTPFATSSYEPTHASMTSATDTYRLLGAFVDELARCGLRDACTSPGSRSTPLVLSLAGDERLRCHSHVDERCAGFFAVGLAKASLLAVAVTCTSGTAVRPAAGGGRGARGAGAFDRVERRPAARAARGGRRADDRPAWDLRRLREVVLRGGHTRGDTRAHPLDQDACVSRLLDGAGRRPGVVHLNFPLREPLVCDELPARTEQGRPDGAPYVTRRPRASDPNARCERWATGSETVDEAFWWRAATSATRPSARRRPPSAPRRAGRCWPTHVGRAARGRRHRPLRRSAPRA